jgi:hypothetical protein
VEKSVVLLHLEELLERKPPLSDIEAIELYEEALEEVLPKSNETWEKIIGQLRWQCVKALPKNEDLSLKSFQACFSKGDLDHARQVSSLTSGLRFQIFDFLNTVNPSDALLTDCQQSREELPSKSPVYILEYLNNVSIFSEKV